MKKNAFIISVILAMTGLLVWSSGCKKDDDTNPDFLIKIDSLVFRDTVNVNDTLFIKFYGTVGPNGCYQFSRFEQVPYQDGDVVNSMKIKVWGKLEDTGNCPDQIVYLDGAEIIVNGFQPGNFNIFVIQPDGSIMNGLVFVTE